MRKTILITTALLASTALAAAQGMGQSGQQGSKEGASPAPSTQRSAPAEKMDQRGAQTKPAETTGQAQGGAAQTGGAANQPAKAASDSKPADSKAMPNRADTQKPMDNKADANKAAADDKSKPDASRAASDTKPANERASGATSTDTRTTTTGQGAAGSRAAVNLSTEQKTRVRTVIREKVRAEPLTNVNFSISVGTRVPREVRYYPLPAEIVEIHPAWRGYHFILVNDQIVIIEPSSFEIVAIIV
jgi:hypothetical protein